MNLKSNFLPYCIAINLFLVCISAVNAQTESDLYQSESIYLQGSKYVKNGVEHTITSWNGDLKQEMEVSPFAAVEYEKFQHTRKVGFIMSTVGILAIGTSLFIDSSSGWENGLLLGGLGLTLASIPIKSKANKSLQKAVWLRNGAVVSEKKVDNR